MDKKTENILRQNNFTLVNIFSLLKAKRLVLFLTIGVFILFGWTYYVTTPDSYETHSILLVESQNSAQSSGLGSLALAAGISVGGNSAEQNVLDPALYPMILQSKPFLSELMYSRVKSELYEDSVSLYKYMVEVKPQNSIYKFLKRPTSILSSPLQIVDSVDEKVIDEKLMYQPLEMYVLSQISTRIQASPEGRLLTISTEMPEADLAYQFSKLVENYLIEYTTKYLQEKQTMQVEYLEAQYLKSEKGFKEAQTALATFRERNQGIYLESLKAREQNLNADYSLKFELYRTIAQELEMAKIKLNSQKPIFSPIEPAFIPNSPSSPKLLVTLALTIMLGAVVGMILIFALYIRQYYLIHRESES
ncbi:Wzz/FepE/Etk N-terminal domain-containing protein [Algoriphagus halophytocola]|uniref:Wzz/FepE/Etk N-terminal domain-containing protein n=1 Tax=Algoriphagus halophytocola TaxID=2991499 RepID=UPI0022DDC316|nr:Wzz/FepE/Etk N-terminal domain-containing protein [Algoriphagus sp. TR-M9]WBL44327.1 Wzz/FepE/Etk N-terminal domain-containing protein [Algoriphagus sp. TR-M9]